MDPDFLGDYRQSIVQRTAQNLPPLGLVSQDVLKLIALFQDPPSGESHLLKDLLLHQVPVGNSDAAKFKAEFLSNVATSRLTTPLLTAIEAIRALGAMSSAYSVKALVNLLNHPDHAHLACDELAATVLLFDAYYDVVAQYKSGHPWAKILLERWSKADWFYKQPALPARIKATVFKISGIITANLLSPMEAAWSRSDIALHAQSLLHDAMPEAIEHIKTLKQSGYPLIFVADEIDTSGARAPLRHAGLNALLWHFGESMPDVPNHVHRGFILASKIDANTYEAAENKGVLVMEGDTSSLQMGQLIDIDLFTQQIKDDENHRITSIALKQDALDSWRAGGRLLWRLGHSLTAKACSDLKKPMWIFGQNQLPQLNVLQPYSLAQKLIGHACGMNGILPGTYCEPRIAVIDGQFMNSLSSCDALKGLPYTGVSVDCVVHPFQHRAVDDKQTHIQLKPGDGIVKYWINHMVLPDEVMLSQDAYTRVALGISFSCTAEQRAFATTMGLMPMVMPESVHIRFYGQPQPGITIQDLVHAIPYMAARHDGFNGSGQDNFFTGRILEIEGLSALTVEQANLFVEASVDRGAAACVVQLEHDVLQGYIETSCDLLRWMIKKGYESRYVLNRRLSAMEEWLSHGAQFSPDQGAQYAATLNINLENITEPLVAAFHNPNEIWRLSEINEMLAIQDVFLGPSGIQYDDYRLLGQLLKKATRALPTRLWITPSNKLEAKQLMTEGVYAAYGYAGAHTDMPDHTLCLGNRLKDNMTIVSTSRHHFSSQRAKGIKGYLTSPRVAAQTALLGRLPQYVEYKRLCAESKAVNPLFYKG